MVNFRDSDKHYHEGRTTMQSGDQPNSAEGAYDTPTYQTTLFPMPQSRPLPIREFLTTDQPRNRLLQHGAAALSDAELLAIITGVGCLETAQRLLIAAGGLRGLHTISTAELQQLVAGISVGKAAQLKAAIELGTRVVKGDLLQRRQIRSPGDIADLLMLEMSHLDQEHLRTVLLDIKNRVQAISTVYIGSLNTSMIRIGEVFKTAVKLNSAALIVAHNHPSGDATPSPEDILVTREIVQAGRLLDVDVLDHLVIGHGTWVSLRQLGLGFDTR
jgi:DNA repair protein RadC